MPAAEGKDLHLQKHVQRARDLPEDPTRRALVAEVRPERRYLLRGPRENRLRLLLRTSDFVNETESMFIMYSAFCIFLPANKVTQMSFLK